MRKFPEKSSLFPATVRDRLMEGTTDDQNKREAAGNKKDFKGPQLFSTAAIHGLQGTENSASGFDGKPIADLFPHVTVMFSDIAGFTAWSSVREPSQVFMLLESVYSSFDKIARRLSIFKVSTDP